MRVKVTPATLDGQDLPAQMVELRLTDEFTIVGSYKLAKCPFKCKIIGVTLEWLSADCKYPKGKFIEVADNGNVWKGTPIKIPIKLEMT